MDEIKTSNVWLVPQSLPSLRTRFGNFEINYTGKTITAFITETPIMTVQKWINNIRRKEEKETIELCFLSNDQTVNRIQFKDIYIVNQTLNINKTKITIFEDTPVEYVVIFGFEQFALLETELISEQIWDEVYNNESKNSISDCSESSYEEDWDKTDRKMVVEN